MTNRGATCIPRYWSYWTRPLPMTILSTQHQPELVQTLDERVEILFRELQLAIKWNRPSILLAIYSSEYVRIDAENALAGKLRQLGQSVVEFRTIGEAGAGIPLFLSQQSNLATTVYFIVGLQQG